MDVGAAMSKHEEMRYSNFSNIFTNIRKNGPVTKKELQAQTGLSWGSISNITNELLSLDVLVQTDDSQGKVGRTAKELDINPNRNLFIGVDINLQGITGVVIDMKGRTHDIIKEPLSSTSRMLLMEQAKKIIHQLLDDCDFPEEIHGIGVSFPGHVNQSQGRSIRIQHFLDFDDYPISQDLQKEFGLEVKLGHDTNCIALAEHTLGIAQDLDNFCLIRIDQGIGMATVYKGEVFSGVSGATGEIGHMIMQPDGPHCSCGNNGCLETYASSLSIIKSCAQGISMGLSPILSGLCPGASSLTLANVMEAVQLKDAYCSTIVGRAATYTGIAIANVINILDPDTLVFCGELTSYPDYLDRVMGTVHEKMWRRGSISYRVSHFHHGVAAAVGSAFQFIEPAFANIINLEA